MKTLKGKAHQVYEGHWYKLKNPWRIGCCDCGLEHEILFKSKKGVLWYKAKIIKTTAKHHSKK
jgi:hypothetical protein